MFSMFAWNQVMEKESRHVWVSVFFCWRQFCSIGAKTHTTTEVDTGGKGEYNIRNQKYMYVKKMKVNFLTHSNSACNLNFKSKESRQMSRVFSIFFCSNFLIYIIYIYTHQILQTHKARSNKPQSTKHKPTSAHTRKL